MASILDIPIQNLKYFGEVSVKKLNKLKIKTVRDLLYHFPNRYEDFSKFLPIAQIKPDAQATAQGTVVKIKNIRIFKKNMVLTEAVISDDSGAIKAIWFNRPYLLNQLKPGQLINLSGKAVLNKNQLYLSSPIYEIVSYGQRQKNKKELLHTGRVIPIYPETSGFTSRWLRLLIKPILRLANQIPDIVPPEFKKKYRLFDISYAFSQIHFPENIEKAELSRRRFAFEELFVLQLFMGQERLKIKKQKSPQIKFDENQARRFVDSLPFKLTNDQKKVAWQIIGDIQKNEPMNRLLEGDVGSGKTIIAAMAAYFAALSGYQTALMAPTEILSRQHFEKISPLFKKFNIKTGLLTSKEAQFNGQKVSKKEFLKQIENNNVKIIIGTHSLIQKSVIFRNLALIIIDEQHRFGVKQRALLSDHHKETIPHLLSMSATPIPRTLGLTIWGDLDLSLIKELPKGRKNIITKIVPPTQRQATYEFIKNEIKKGRQAFVICPLIEEPPPREAGRASHFPGGETKAAVKEYQVLKNNIFPQFKTGLLHGRLKPKEKEKIMADFLEKKVDILVTTSVVEVGIDVANATVMMIEGADRFGLASLYQFRGRVGRSEQQSYCFLLTDSVSEKTAERLKAIESARNGFELAERDLEMRGPGDFIGTRQAGLPDLAVASLVDAKLVEETREAAKAILSHDPNLIKYPLLEKRVSEFKNKIHFE